MPGPKLTSEKLTTWDWCPRRALWTDRYVLPRIGIVPALYKALDAGLTGADPEKAAENEFLSLAANPGLDIWGRDTFAVAMHHAKLVAIIAVAIRSAFAAPWTNWRVEAHAPEVQGWSTALYGSGQGLPRRVVLVDRWSDDRRLAEVRSWRTLGECVVLNTPILLTAVTIGASKDGRRHSAWTKCYRHPKNRNYRFKRRTATEDFSATWAPVWRENTDIPTAEWLKKMQNDGCMGDVLDTITVQPPPRREAFVKEIMRASEEMRNASGTPPMRLTGCSPVGYSACPFQDVCFGKKEPTPEAYGFRIKSSGSL